MAGSEAALIVLDFAHLTRNFIVAIHKSLKVHELGS